MDYRNLSNRRTIRLQGYDYASPGYYFVTICTKEKEHVFGEIRDGTMYTNAFGDMATDEWYLTESIRDNVQLDAFVVMPNHVHGIIRIIDNVGPNVGAYRNTPRSPQTNMPRPRNEMAGKKRANNEMDGENGSNNEMDGENGSNNEMGDNNRANVNSPLPYGDGANIGGPKYMHHHRNMPLPLRDGRLFGDINRR